MAQHSTAQHSTIKIHTDALHKIRFCNVNGQSLEDSAAYPCFVGYNNAHTGTLSLQSQHALAKPADSGSVETDEH